MADQQGAARATRPTTARSSGSRARERDDARADLVGLARAFGGALFFALPLLMTMEMWRLGFYMDRLRLAVLLLAFLPMLVGLAHFAGFETTTGWMADVQDALVAVAVGFVTAALVLALIGVLARGVSVSEGLGTVVLTGIPASVGAALAKSILGGQSSDERRSRDDITYGGELFLMAAGAVFFAFNIAPTEEMVLIALRMTAWHLVAAGAASLLLMHAFVYAVEFRGQEAAPAGATPLRLFLHFTVPGYAIALVLSAFVLWTFGRLDGTSGAYAVALAVVLAFPASLGAAAARLVL